MGGDSRQRNDFAYFGPLVPRRSQFFMKFQHARPVTGATMQTLFPFKLFLYPMDRAEVLHAQSYDLSGRRKMTRRDGFACWRVIFFVAAGMLSGN